MCQSIIALKSHKGEVEDQIKMAGKDLEMIYIPQVSLKEKFFFSCCLAQKRTFYFIMFIVVVLSCLTGEIKDGHTEVPGIHTSTTTPAEQGCRGDGEAGGRGQSETSGHRWREQEVSYTCIIIMYMNIILG